MSDLLSYYSFKNLYKIAGKKNPIIDIKKFEVYISIIISLFICTIILLVLKTNYDIEYVISNTRGILVNTAFGLLGLLGFIISGLAIISGTIGVKVTQQLIAKSKFEALLGILFSFYYIGLIIGLLIFLVIIAYFLLLVNLPLNVFLFVLLSFVLSYGLFFCVFYCFSLMGTCINIFVINYKHSREVENMDEENVRTAFDNSRINALLLILLQKNLTDRQEFIETLTEVIEGDCSEDLKEKVLQKAMDHYRE